VTPPPTSSIIVQPNDVTPHLGKRSRKRILEHIEKLGDPDKTVSARAELLLLRYYRDRVFELILPVCSHPNPVVRFRAAWIIAHSGRAEAFEVLRQMSTDPDRRVRFDVRVALGVVGGEESIALLISQIEEGNDEEGASWMGLQDAGPAAMAPLTALAARANPELRAQAVDVLSTLGSVKVR
jgi:HEAT repeat protein